MNTFETIIIFNPNLLEEKDIKKYTDLIQGFSKTKKVRSKDMGIKKLAYTITKETHGYYVLFDYHMENQKVNLPKLEKELRLDDKVLKFLTVKNTVDKLDDLISIKNSKIKNEQMDAYDVMLGLADYK